MLTLGIWISTVIDLCRCKVGCLCAMLMVQPNTIEYMVSERSVILIVFVLLNKRPIARRPKSKVPGKCRNFEISESPLNQPNSGPLLVLKHEPHEEKEEGSQKLSTIHDQKEVNILLLYNIVGHEKDGSNCHYDQ